LVTDVLHIPASRTMAWLMQDPVARFSKTSRPRWLEKRGVEMKSTLAIATIAIMCAAGHPIASTAPSFALTLLAGENTASPWSGRWQGTTVAGQPLVLELQVQGQRKQSAKIIYGKVVGDGFALTTGPIDGHAVDGSGRHVGDVIELTIEGVKKPLTLTRMN
jgi:hypothetical protein